MISQCSKYFGCNKFKDVQFELMIFGKKFKVVSDLIINYNLLASNQSKQIKKNWKPATLYIGCKEVHLKNQITTKL